MAANTKVTGLALIAFSSILWGTESIATMVALKAGFNPQTLALYVLSMDLLVFIPLGLVKGGSPWSLGLILSGLILAGGFRISFPYSVIVNGAGIAAALLYTAPLLLSFLSPLLLRTKYSVLEVFLSAIAVGGAYLASNPELKIAAFIGFLIGLIPAVFYALQIIVVKYYHERGYSTIDILFQSSPLSIIIPLITVFYSRPRGLPSFNGLIWATYIAIVCSTLTLLLYVEGLRYVSAVSASIIALLEPVTALLLAHVFLGEKYVSIQMLGITLVLIATLFSSLLELRYNRSPR